MREVSLGALGLLAAGLLVAPGFAAATTEATAGATVAVMATPTVAATSPTAGTPTAAATRPGARGESKASTPPAFRGSTAAEGLGAAGWLIVEERQADLDGDGAPEAMVIEGRLEEGPEPETLRVGFWKRGADGWTLRFRTEPLAANRVGLVAFGSVGCGDVRALVEVVEETPDEVRRTLLVFGGEKPALREAIASHGAHRDPSLLDASFLDQGLGFSRAPDGSVLVLENPVIVELAGPAGQRRSILLGARERQFTCADGTFVAGPPAFRDGSGSRQSPAGPAGDGDLSTGVQPAQNVRLQIPSAGGARMLRLVPGCAPDESSWTKNGQVQRIRLSGLMTPPMDIDLDAKVPTTDQRMLASGMLPLGGAPWGRQLLVVFGEPLPQGQLVVEVLKTTGPGCVAEVGLQ